MKVSNIKIVADDDSFAPIAQVLVSVPVEGLEQLTQAGAYDVIGKEFTDAVAAYKTNINTKE